MGLGAVGVIKGSGSLISFMCNGVSVTQCGAEVGQDSELSKDDRPFRVAVEALDLAACEFKHVAAGCVHLLTRSWQLAKGSLQRTIVGTWSV